MSRIPRSEGWRYLWPPRSLLSHHSASLAMTNRHQFMLVPLVLLLLAQPLMAEGVLPGYATKLLSLMVILGAYRIVKPHRVLTWITGLMFVVATLAVPTSEITVGDAAHFAGNIASVIALSTIALVITYQAVREHSVTKDTLLGAVVVYLLIGISVTYVYEMIELSQPGSFTNLTGGNTAQTFAEMAYYSLVTLTTLGYGDIVPVAPVARALATLEAILGQFYVAALVGLLVSRGSSKASRHLPAPADPAPEPRG